jgi:rhodanese-related sulfurtransferase
MSDSANDRMTAEEYRTRHMSEEAIHKAVVDWADRQAQAEPALELLFHCPNGGSRHPAEAKKLRQMGVRQGYPDLTLPVPTKRASDSAYDPYQHIGLALELKSPSGHLRDTQKWWIGRLREQGLAIGVAWSFAEAHHIIQRYLDGEHEPQELDLSGAEPPRHVE